MSLNFCYKKVFVRKIILKENDTHYFLQGDYNIDQKESYIQIEKITFDKNNNKNPTLENIIKFGDININEEKSSNIKEEKPDNNNQQINNENNNSILEAKVIKLDNIERIDALFGFIKFNMGYYVILACDSEIVGRIGRNIIYRVGKLKYFPLFIVDAHARKTKKYSQEKRYFELVRNFSYDKQLYFSFSYNLTYTLQRNYVQNFKKEMANIYKSLNNENKKMNLNIITNDNFCWNHYHIEEFFNLILKKDEKYFSWLNFFIYGYFCQKFCNLKGSYIQISVVGRRNRHYAGTRYLKRGITSDGYVANDVETEQILEEVNGWIDRPKISSFIQIRGSIPVFWYQTQNAFYQKPEIKVNLSDIRFEATKKHFSKLIERYGTPIIVCNLAKKIEDGKRQESLLSDLYSNGISYINDTLKENQKILYYHYDLKRERVKKDFYKHFYNISCSLISKINLFSFIPNLKNKYNISLQNGVIRTNCIDCLDRTNVLQQILGIAILVIQLKLIGLNETFPESDSDDIYGTLTSMYKSMGHELSNQYTGTSALKQSINESANLSDKIIDVCYEIIIACKRSMINYFNDQTKQNALNLFLGKYHIDPKKPLIWDMPNDENLHKNENSEKLKGDWYADSYKKYRERNLFKELENEKLEKEDKKGIIYIKKNVEEEKEINKKNQENQIQMSVISKLICKSLDTDQNDFTLNKKKYTNSDINEYILDYSEYLNYKKKILI